MKLIDEDAVVAKIIELDGLNCLEAPTISHNEDYKCGYSDALEELRNFLDSFKAEDVDLDKIINDYFKDWKFDDELDVMVKPNNYSASFTDLKEIAKHFFELGIKAQKGE